MSNLANEALIPHIGIVTDAAAASGSGAFSFVDIEGNSAGTVRERPRLTTDADIFGYMNMEKVIDNWNGTRRALVDWNFPLKSAAA